MFERYTEYARRSIFFARYEAALFHSRHIETEHLAIGVLRADTVLAGELSLQDLAAIRERLGPAPAVTGDDRAVDLPFSFEARNVLVMACSEADALRHERIDAGHLLLGLLRVETSTAGKLLREFGVDYETCRLLMARKFARPAPAGISPTRAPAAAVSLRAAIDILDGLLAAADREARSQPPAYGEQRLKRKPWTRQEAVGHLVD